MSRKRDCRDNAPMALANGAVKVECVRGVRCNIRVMQPRLESSTSVTATPSGCTRR